MTVREWLPLLTAEMTVSGSEHESDSRLRALLAGQFDEVKRDGAGNYLLFRRSTAAGAKLLLIDAHYDEIGLMVSEHQPGGFLGCVAVGGVDEKVLPASDVLIYGKEILHGVITSTPPHLQKRGDEERTTPLSELWIDTGYDTEVLRTLAPIGTPVGFSTEITDLANDCICCKGLDNKISCAVALAAATEAALPPDWGICVSLSAKEELGCLGARCTANAIHPTAAITLDVEFARIPDTPIAETTLRFGGATIALSAITDRTLTSLLLQTAIKEQIRHQKVVWAGRTGTNADQIALSRRGVPCALMGVPILNMHTAVEVVALSDAEAAADLLIAMLEGGLSQWEAQKNAERF